MKIDKQKYNKYKLRHMSKLGYVKLEKGEVHLVKPLPSDKQLKLEIALSNYREKYPTKERNKVVSKDDMNGWLDIIFTQTEVFPLSSFLKELKVKNAHYFTKTLIELEYIKAVKGRGTDILVDKYDVDLVYKNYCQNVKNHTKKYKKPKKSYNTEYSI